MIDQTSNMTARLQQEILAGAMATLSLTSEINQELLEVSTNGISMGDEALLERVGLFVNRNSAEYRFDKLRLKVAAYIGERKALIDAGNRLLQAHGAQLVNVHTDYGLSDCQADGDTGHTNTEWDEHMTEAYGQMQASIEAVEADVAICQYLLSTLT